MTDDGKQALIISEFLDDLEPHFNELNTNCINQLDFAKECEFALQILKKNDYLCGVGKTNPFSLKSAISNVAAIGITLNPALAFAYLVPRKNAVCLDISYRGLIKLATDTGVIKAMKAEIVYENDDFNYHGFHEKPEFHADPFGDRGNIRGVYAMALLTDGGVLVETMSIDEVFAIRDDTEAYKSVLEKDGRDSYKFKQLPWVKYEGEQIKKTVIKRAYKTLPTSKGTEIMGKAIEVINQHEGIEFNKEPDEIFYTDEELAEYKRCVDEDDYFNLVPLERSVCVEANLQLQKLCVPEAQKGEKGKQKKEISEKKAEINKELNTTLDILRDKLDEADDLGVIELRNVWSSWTTEYLINQLSTEHQIQFNQAKEAA